jgi:SAM-dependent methyltransferase
MGLDNSPEHVDFCRSLGLDARLMEVDQGLDTVPDGAFDFVWVSDIVEHLDAPRLLLRRLQPKLKPEGRVLLYVSTLPRSRLARTVFRRAGITSYEAGTHYYQFTQETACFLLERAGYRVETVAVPLLRRRYQRLGGFLRLQAPTLILGAKIDEQAERQAREAEHKNKPNGV